MITVKTHKDYIKYLNAEGRLKEAINELYEGAEALDKNKLQDSLILLLSSFNQNERNKIEQPNPLNYQNELNRISRALNFYLRDYEPLPSFRTSGFENYLSQQKKSTPPTPISKDKITKGIKLPPVIFTAFANKEDNYLDNLKKEEKAIGKSLIKFDTNHVIKHVNRDDASTDDLFEVFEHYAGQIRIFHYGGHASPDYFALNQQKAFMTGLVNRLGKEHEQGEVVLVFLNGCSTFENVDKLLSKGIKAVIATSASIDDGLATLLAKRFYKNLALGQTIKDAYENAISYLKTLSNEEKINHLDNAKRLGDMLGSENDLLDKNKPLSWGLYANDLTSISTIKLTNLHPTFLEETNHNNDRNLLPQEDNLPKQSELIDLIEENEFAKVFELLEPHRKHFRGYTEFRDEYLFDNPRGSALRQFRERLKMFINLRRYN